MTGEPGQFTPRRYRPGKLGNWSGHLPFANDLVRALQPSLLVELGTHYGESYFGFCQAVEESGASTKCFAVDTWRGDEHSGFYPEEVFEEIEAYNRAHYERFSTLLRETFDEASARFEADSIELLHIDGLHTYAAVKHDFEKWLPKVRPGGIVLLHDTNARHGDFEVWRVWEELAREYVNFDFRHCWGLGVLKKPGRADTDFTAQLFAADAVKADQIRAHYVRAAELLEERQRSPEERQAAAEADRPYLQVFAGMLDGGFQETNSVLSNVQERVWKRHVLTLPNGIEKGLLRIDPVNREGIVEIGEIAVRRPDDQAAIPIPLSSARCEGQLRPLPGGDTAHYFSWGNDPQLIVELAEFHGNGGPLEVEVFMRVSFECEPLRQLLAHNDELERQVARFRLEASKECDARTRTEWSLAAAETQIAHLRRENSRLSSGGVRPVEQFVEQAVRDGRMAGAVLLIARGGSLVTHRAMGWLDREAALPMPLDGLFYVLSMTKALTCAAFLSLVEEGKVTLEDPVELWLPEFRNLAFADGRKPQRAPVLWQCMAHSSGLLDSFPESFMKSRFNLPEFVSVGARNHLGYEPGEGWAYCNLGIAVIGRVIELASGRPYLEMVQERVLDPIQMTNSFFRVPAEQLSRIAAIYRVVEGQLVRDSEKPFANLPEYSAPENGLMTTALDIWRFHEMIRNGGMIDGRRVLSERSARSMAEVQTGNRNAGFLPGMGYGFGLSLVTQPTGMFRNHSVGTFGHGSFYQAHAWTDPAKGITGILFSHKRADPMIVTPEVEQFVRLMGEVT